MAEQQDYLPGEFERVSPLRPRRSKRTSDEPVVIPKGEPSGTEDAAESEPKIPAEAKEEARPSAEASPEATVPDKAAEKDEDSGAEVSQVPEPPPAATVAPKSGEAGGLEGRLGVLLDEFIGDSAEIEASAVVSLDGFIMAAALPADLEEDRVAAMSAAILALGERAASELGRGRLSQVFIEGEGGYVLLMSCGNRAALVGMAAKDAKLGLIFYDMRRVAQGVSAMLAGG